AVSFTLDVTDPGSGNVKVEMGVENNRDDELTLGIPVWAPGRYQVLPFYRAVRNLEAEIDGKKTEVAATDSDSRWTLKTGRAGKFTVRYTLRPQAVQVLQGNLTPDHYDLDGPAAYLYIKGRMNGPHQVTFKLPEGWKVGTGLKKLGDATYGARDYDTFIDCPTELGTFDLHTFTHDNVTYELVVHAAGPVDGPKLTEICRKIVTEQMKMLGPAPFDRYVFLLHFPQARVGNGLEHLNSTDIDYGYMWVKDDPLYAASVLSHEFFHLWNVKRIRPKELGPFDYSQPVRSKALWFSEGVTSYYGDLSLLRAGVWTREQYFQHLAEEVRQLQRNPVRKTQPVEESSRTVWDRPRGSWAGAVDYYNKGELLGLLLDLRIRKLTSNRKSLDDLMRHLYRTLVVEPGKAGKGEIGIGFEEDGILKAANAVAGSDLTEFFAKYVSGTEELPYATILEEAGIRFQPQKVKALGVPMTGLRISVDPPEGSEAAKSGLRKDDRIVRIGGSETSNRSDVAKALEGLKVGDRVKVTFSRSADAKDEEVEVEADLPIVDRETGAYLIGAAPDPSDLQRGIVEGWLGSGK
ncbi:MAG TPA: PDZ domain-containing protein, partial [Planctomycetota bacterium]|nr:PDZ domain-containing protein [Planctomycetota bacterium]